MKTRGQRAIDSSTQKKDSFPESLTIDSSSPAESQIERRCYIEDAKTKFGTFFFGLLLMSVGAALLYYGFRPEWQETTQATSEASNTTASSTTPPSNKISRDNKLLLTTGFIAALLGLFCFVVGILMFKNVPCLYNDNMYHIEEEA